MGLSGDNQRKSKLAKTQMRIATRKTAKSGDIRGERKGGLGLPSETETRRMKEIKEKGKTQERGNCVDERGIFRDSLIISEEF